MCIVSASNRGYDCVCKAGFKGNGNAHWSRNDGFFDTVAMGSKGQKGCADIDECDAHAHNCIPEAEVCHNVHPNQGKFICINIAPVTPCLTSGMCPSGYNCYQTSTAPFYTCVDNDECLVGDNDCTVHQDCVNVPGTYKCNGLADPNNVCIGDDNPCTGNANGLTQCVVTANSYNCIDKDECTDGTHNCNPGEYCVDQPGSYSCKAGHDPDPYELCTEYECQDHSACTLSDDKKTRSCICVPGYTPSIGGLCVDEDECVVTPLICGSENCINNEGGFDCMNNTAFSDFLCAQTPDVCGTVDADAKCIGAGSVAAPVMMCTCSSAFFGKDADGKCVDFLECSHPTPCPQAADPVTGTMVDGYCIENVGAVQTCDYTSDPLNQCDPVNPCGEHGTCMVSVDKLSYTCSCHPGYQEGSLNALITTCLDTDECADSSLNTCLLHETCTNQPAGYTCENNPDPFGKCMGWNNKCTGDAVCVVSTDKLSSSCKCPTGYYWGQDWQGNYGCNDVDECSTGQHTCNGPNHEYCANIPGSFYCGLHAGPCAYGQHDCHPLAMCRPSYAARGYDCDCMQGYKGNGNAQHGRNAASIIAYGPNGPKGCIDINECQAGIAQCVAGQECVNKVGTYSCTNAYDPYGKCAEGSHECHPLAVCTPNSNNNKGYDCTCSAGYEGNGKFQFGRQDAISMGTNGPKGCVDLDECASGRDKCSTHQQCVNLEGGYSCVGDFDPMNKCDTNDCSNLQSCVPNAYTYKGYSCQDIDECLEGLSACTINQLCVNVNYGVGYKCMGPPDPQMKCSSGSKGELECSAIKASCSPDNSPDGYRCADIDECSGDVSPCATGDFCVNKVNGFACTSDSDPFNVCTLIGCGANSDCTPSLDLLSPTCSCHSGFMADVITNECVDINECADAGLNNCTGTIDWCLNTDGAYTCSSNNDPYGVCGTIEPACPVEAGCAPSADKLTAVCTCLTGYTQPTATTCTDIDECLSNNGNCAVPTFCVNSAGSFECSNATDPYGVCAMSTLGDIACTNNGVCEPDVATGKQSYICACDVGYTNSGNQGSCVDADECINPTICSAVPDAVCINTAGGFNCDNSTDPLGMCNTGSHKCGPYGTCRVTGAGKDGYTCDCASAGYELDGTGWTCVDVDECDANNGGCTDDEFCKNTVGGMECTTQDKEDPNGLCDTVTNAAAVVCLGMSASCAVSEDKLSAFCVCPMGFYYDANSGCVDINECAYSMMNLCTTQEKCFNTIGSYTCQPHPDPLGKCATAKCDPRAHCQPNYNNKQGYDCICAVGYFGNGNFQYSRNDVSFGANAPKGCKDVDECKNNLHNCALSGQYCLNTEGSYVCSDTSNPGHPCTTGSHNCHHLSTCAISYSNKVGYTCTCNAGFKGNGKKQTSSITGNEIAEGGPKGCVDVDECKFDLDNCGFGQFCYNTIGAFTCYGPISADPCDGVTCTNGLECAVDAASGQSGCADVNECVLPGMCGVGQHCVNTYSSFNCVPDTIPSQPCATGTHSCSIYQNCVPNGNEAVCEDRNECIVTGHDCTTYQNCYNTNPGWMCFNDPQSVCRGNTCHHHATCIANSAMKSGYDCVCNSGYHGNGNRQYRYDQISNGVNGPKGCDDINECESSVNPCGAGSVCYNTDGGHLCVQPLDGNDPYGACAFGAHDCDNLASCVPDKTSKQGYNCVCNAGYKGNGNKQMRAEINEISYGGAKGCVDVNECSASNADCGVYQVCYNTAGSYICLGDADPLKACDAAPCGVGFNCHAVNTYQGYACADQNECTDMTSDCANNQVCVNYPGSYACQNTTTVAITVIGNPVGTVAPTTVAPPGPTVAPANPCDSMPLNEFNSTCAPGWMCIAVGVIGQCIDINECFVDPLACPWGTICSNYPGGHMCLEDPEYVCRHGAHNCNKIATCIPLEDSKKGYDCLCNPGYFGNGNNKPTEDGRSNNGPKGCTDMDECLDIPCATNETCINTAGSFVCYPNPVDPNLYETACSDNDCDYRANCVLNAHNNRGYDCECKEGYHGNGNAQYRFDSPTHNGPKGCVNFDECSKGTHTCGFTQGCVDTEGAYLCVNDPYGVCMPGRHTCNLGSVCTPKSGQLWDHDCTCRVGFTDSCLAECGTTWSFCYRTCLLTKGGSGNICEDVDECMEPIMNDCPSNATCLNAEPGFTCSFASDPYDLCMSNGPCDSAVSTCEVDATDKNIQTCACLPGFLMNTTTAVCDDVDECMDVSDPCDPTNPTTPTICVNDIGGFTCSNMTDPFHVCDGLGEPHNCGNFTCETVLPAKTTYTCLCDTFTVFDSVSQSCVDVDECKSGASACPAGEFCINQVAQAPICSNATDPLDLCSTMDCGGASAGNCEVTPDKYTAFCTCLTGYEIPVGSVDGMCMDTDECNNPFIICGVEPAGRDPAAADFCINVPGGYNCTSNPDPFNVCAEGAHNCGWRGECTPDTERTGQICTCETGYYDICEDACEFSLDPLCYPACIASLFGTQRCKNINECSEYKPAHTCLGTESCADLDGTFDCLDKCELANVCDEKASCVADYSEEGYHCSCATGYHGNGKIQPLNAVAGLYGAGSYKRPKGCLDIDECAFKLHNCVAGEMCVNLPGSFNCSVAHDPFGVCEFNQHDCHPFASCVVDHEAKRGYTCECNSGYYGNGNFQYVIDTGRKRRVASGLAYLGSHSSERGMPVDMAYIDSIPTYQEVVASGGNNAPKGCLNIDECFYGLDDCNVGNEVCFDTIGSFMCAPTTTTPAPPTIAPTACFMAQNECDAEADCFADPLVPGGLFCKCRAGFSGDGTVKKDERGSRLRGCTDIDECSDKVHSCIPFEDEYCNNLYGSYECITNIMCNGLTKCHPMATCQPVGERDYDCNCPEGYEGFGLGPKGCFDVDECGDKTDKCHSTALCFNQMVRIKYRSGIHKIISIQGSYQCRCPDNMGGILPGSVPNMEACDGAYSTVFFTLYETQTALHIKLCFSSELYFCFNSPSIFVACMAGQAYIIQNCI